MTKSKTYTLDDLIFLVMSLRDPENGCPWDVEQTFQSIVPHTIEEVYEVVDAIEREDFAELKLELGDLLFQVVFYAQLATEEGKFDFQQIVSSLVEKLVRRHPHVFPDGSLDSYGLNSGGSNSGGSNSGGSNTKIEVQEVLRNWEAIKSQERQQKKGLASTSDDISQSSAWDDVPNSFPALLRAAKLQKRAATIGFDWTEVAAVIEKLKEEIKELEQAISERQERAIADEMGDVFFSCVNLARHLKLDSETVLRAANNKFEKRFRRLERLSLQTNGALVDKPPGKYHKLSADELNKLWQQCKEESAP